MLQEYEIKLCLDLKDLNPTLAGEAHNPPNNLVYPDANKAVLIHTVISGSGMLYSRGASYPVKAGQAFIVMPDDAASYKADCATPWAYRWIAFTGSMAERFSVLPPVFDLPPDALSHLKALDSTNENLGYYLAADLHLLYATLIRQQSKKKNHINAVSDYVHSHYMNKITLQDLANYVGVNPNYLSYIFKKKTGMTIQSHIMDVRLLKAKHYLFSGYSVKETAFLCGFNDANNFSKAFKQNHPQSLTPSQWKKDSAVRSKEQLDFLKTLRDASFEEFASVPPFKTKSK